MRTTVDIDEDLLLAAEQRARAERKTAGQLISDLVRKGLAESDEPLDLSTIEIVDGFPLLPSRGGPVVTTELVDRLLEEADLEDARFSLKR